MGVGVPHNSNYPSFIQELADEENQRYPSNSDLLWFDKQNAKVYKQHSYSVAVRKAVHLLHCTATKVALQTRDK